GKMDDWAANDPHFAKMIGWTSEPLPFTDTFAQIWSLGYAHGTLYAGTKPASLLASENGGKDWKRGPALTDHPWAGGWNPGAAGVVLHIIVSDPGNSKKTLGWNLGGRRLRDRGRRRDMGTPEPSLERRSGRSSRPPRRAARW